MATTRREVMAWIDEELAQDPSLRQEVEARLNELRLEQQLAALREARGLSQTQVAERVGVSQPAIAKLESGKVKNLQVKTLVRLAAALGARVTIEFTAEDQNPPRMPEGSPPHPSRGSGPARQSPPQRVAAKAQSTTPHRRQGRHTP
jgi:transcriptional regulator with XRE-family HTH domain